MKDLTLITCSYETPMVTLTMLKSFKYHNEKDFDKMNLLIMENSNDESTRTLLDAHNIRYVSNVGGTHSKSLDKALKMCKTKYALVVDTDIIFYGSIIEEYKRIKQEHIILSGIECGDRGGLSLYARIHPWFMFVDVEEINIKKINFHDDVRINYTNSNDFYGHIPLIKTRPTGKLYDVGSTFYEDLINEKCKIDNNQNIQKLFKHYEGTSWYTKCGIKRFVEHGNKVMDEYSQEVIKYQNVNVNNYFI